METCAAVQLGQKLASPVVDDRPIIHSPEDAADLVQYEMSGLSQEELRVIILNTRNRVIKIVTIYRGSLNFSQIRVGEIFRPAIRLNAAAIIVVHNHRAQRSAILSYPEKGYGADPTATQGYTGWRLNKSN